MSKPKQNSKKNIKDERAVSKRTSSGNNSSNQKENRPKKRKLNKPDTDGIAMSQQLQMKKLKTKNNVRAKRQSKNLKRVKPNGKPMPSLAELELLFQDSEDDDEESHPKPVQERSTTPEVLVNNIDVLFSPTTCARITKQVKDIMANNYEPKASNSNNKETPPKKLLKVDSNHNKLQDLHLTSSNLIDNTDTNFSLDTNEQHKRKLSFDDMVHVNKMQKPNIDGNSSDSSDTIEYKLSPHAIYSHSVSQKFCPLPSTSKDNQTFIKNDELFNKSIKEITVSNDSSKEIAVSNVNLKEIAVSNDSLGEIAVSNVNLKEIAVSNDSLGEIAVSNVSLKEIAVYNPVSNDNLPNQDDDDLEIVEMPIETITISDNIKTEKVTNLERNSTNVTESDNRHNMDDDDDCVIIETTPNTAKHKIDPTEVIDIDYPLLGTITNTNIANITANVTEEVIDIDALIKQNQTVLTKFNKFPSKKTDTTNVVIDVDVSTILDNTKFQNSVKHENLSENAQNQTKSNCEVVDITDSDERADITSEHYTTLSKVSPLSNTNPGNSTNVGNVVPINLSGLETLQIIHEVTNFFKHNSIPPVNGEMSNAPQTMHLPNLSLLLPEASRSRINNNGNLSSGSSENTTTSRNSYVSSSVDIISQNPNNHTSRSGPLYRQTPKHTSKKKKRKNIPDDISKNNNIEHPSTPEKTSGTIGDCPICMESLSGTAIGSTICGHVFCMGCLKTAVRTSKRCPTCRKVLKNNGFHQLFL